MNLAILLIVVLGLVLVRPADGGNHPRKEQKAPAKHQPFSFHPPKDWEQ